MRIGVIGTGYVGLVTGACLAELGHEVCCIDNDRAKVDRLLAGDCPIYEPDLPALIARNRMAGRLGFSSNTADGVTSSDVVFIAVGTPPGADGEADLSFVHAAARDVAGHLRGFTLVATKSTVPVGTGDDVEAILAAHAPDVETAVVSNPEFLREGCAIGDFLKPDRIVVGAETSRARAMMEAVYRPLTARGHPLLACDRRTAELIKYASNAFLAVKISYINEIADLCENIGADALCVAEGMGLDARIGARFLQPGPGYGGSCFPKDTQALLATARRADTTLSVVASAETANRRRKRNLAARVADATGDLTDKVVAVLGLAFKAGTDDMREAAALDLIPGLQARGAIVRASDPEAIDATRTTMPGAAFFRDAYAAAQGADVLVVLTEWPAYASLDLERIRRVMRGHRVIDFRNLLAPEAVVDAGLDYVSLGRPACRRSIGAQGHGAPVNDRMQPALQSPDMD
jgi:UDPglucose 6-dehydrogenase